MSAPAADAEPRSSPPPAAPDAAPAAAAASAAAASSSASPASPFSRPSQPWTALVLGASGATGRVLVAKLAANPRVERVNCIVRRELPSDYFGPLTAEQQAKVQLTNVDFAQLDASAAAFRGYSAAFSCLGSTRAKAGSKDEFYRQDYGVITHSARLCKEGGIPHFGLMSSSGSDHKSSFHYLRTKGEIEQHLMHELKFPSLSIFRPGLLLTERQGESRLGEKIAQKVIPFFHKLLPERLCGVHVETVAEAMMQNAEHVVAEREKASAASGEAAQAEQAQPAARIYENADIRAMRVSKL